jgi:PAS domain S-box-containing protein
MTDSHLPSDETSRDRQGEAKPGSGMAGPAETHHASPAMRAFKHHLVKALFVVVITCLVGVGWLTWHYMHAARESLKQGLKTRVVIQSLGGVLSSLKDAEAGQRGFIITGQPEHLESYRVGLDKLQTRLADLRRLSEANPRQLERLTEITPLVEGKLVELEGGIALRQAQGFPAAREAVLAESNKNIMNQISVLVGSAQEDEAKRLQDRVNQGMAENLKITQSVLMGSLLEAFALLLLSTYLWWELVRRRRSDTALQASEQRLRVATDAAEMGIWMWQPDEDLIIWDNQRPFDILGVPRTGPPVDAARFAAEFSHPEDIAAFKQAFTYTVENGARLFYQGRFYRPDGELRWVEFTGQVVQGAVGQSLRVIGTVRDITANQQAGQALLESQRFLRAIFDGLSGNSIVLDETGTVLAVNEAWRQFFINNQSSITAVGVGVNYLQHCRLALSQDGNILKYSDGIKDVIVGRRTYFEMEYPCDSATGQRWYVMRASRFKDEGPIRIIIVHDDCTERKLAEEASRESEKRYRDLFNSMDEGFCIVDMLFDEYDKPVDYRFVEINPAFEKQSGLHNVVGKRVLEILPDLEKDSIEAYGKVAVSGESIRMVTKVEGLARWFDLYAFRFDGSKSSRVALLFSDITLRMQAEQTLGQLNAQLEQRVQERTAQLSQSNADLQGLIAAKELLRESEERLLTVAENLTEGLIITSIDGDFIHWNRAGLNMHGFTCMEEVLGTLADFSKLVEINTLAGSDLPIDQWPMARAQRGELVRNCELRIRRTDTGIERILSYGGTSVRDSVGKQSAFLTVTDITERKQADQQLRELNETLELRVIERTQTLINLDQRKDEFLAMLSHELRNPLAAIANAVTLLSPQKKEDPLMFQACSIIERQVGQLKNLVNDLLDLSRITTGRIRLRKERIAVSDFVELALDTVQPLIAQRRHELTVSLPLQPLWLLADAPRLEQVLVNLLANAAKYTDAGGHLWLSVEQEGDAVALRVRDTGIGISPELLPHIFELFTQAERAIDRSQGGLGIGLCLVQRLVEMHGGSVEAQSVLGQGSEFVVRLPVIPAGLPRTPLTPPLIELARAPGTARRVLVVDDNVDATKSLAVLLKMSGHEVQSAYDGPGALDAVLAMRPDVVLLDIGLPGLTGYEVAQWIRQQPALKDIVLVALTGYGRATDLQLAFDAGFDHHLVKPADFREVEKIVANVANVAIRAF